MTTDLLTNDRNRPMAENLSTGSIGVHHNEERVRDRIGRRGGVTKVTIVVNVTPLGGSRTN